MSDKKKITFACRIPVKAINLLSIASLCLKSRLLLYSMCKRPKDNIHYHWRWSTKDAADISSIIYNFAYLLMRTIGFAHLQALSGFSQTGWNSVSTWLHIFFLSMQINRYGSIIFEIFHAKVFLAQKKLYKKFSIGVFQIIGNVYTNQ